MTEREKVLIKMFKRDDFEFLEEEGIRYYEDIYELLDDKADDLYDLFELGQNNPDFEGGSLFYYYMENKILSSESLELLKFNLKKFLKYYKKEYGEEDELYKKFLITLV